MRGNPPKDLDFELQLVTDHWTKLSEELGRVPRLSEFNLMDVYQAAPCIFIADQRRDEMGLDTYRWRYWGTKVRDHTGIEATGKTIEETHNDDARSDALASYRQTLDTGEPEYWVKRTRTVPLDRSYLTYRRIIFPLLDSNDKPRHILGVFIAEERAVPLIGSGEMPAPGGKIDFGGEE